MKHKNILKNCAINKKLMYHEEIDLLKELWKEIMFNNRFYYKSLQKALRSTDVS